jgi:hypothetical protein
LNSVDEEFEAIRRTITSIEKMDDDALSKFLKKEDLQNFKKATKALDAYYSTLKKIETEGSSVLVAAKGRHKQTSEKLEAAKEKQSYRGQVVEEKAKVLTDSGYFSGKEKVKLAE